VLLLPTVGLSASTFDPSCSHYSHWVCGVGGVSARCILFRLAVWLTAIFSFLVGCTGFGPVQMSPKPEPLDTSSSAVQREHHPISHSSIQSLPIPTASNSRFGASLPALQDPRCVLSLFRCSPPYLTYLPQSTYQPYPTYPRPCSLFSFPILDAVVAFRSVESCWFLHHATFCSSSVMFISTPRRS